MEFFAALEHRRSIRAYAAEPLDASKIDAILDAVRLAPSAGDVQAYRIALVESGEAKAALAEAAFGQSFLAQAPLVLVFFADPERSGAKYSQRGRTLFALQDATIAAAYAQLSAAAIGLGSCWVGAFDDAAVARVLAAPDELRPVAIIPIGVAAEAPERPVRRSRDALVVRETFAAGRKPRTR